MILAYLAGKYTAGPTFINIEIAKTTAMRLWQQGFAVICPHTNMANFEKESSTPYEAFMEGCLEMVRRCDVIFMLPDWEQSPGATKERELAIELRIPILYINT